MGVQSIRVRGEAARRGLVQRHGANLAAVRAPGASCCVQVVALPATGGSW